jgi:hypothetical protein
MPPSSHLSVTCQLSSCFASRHFSTCPAPFVAHFILQLARIRRIKRRGSGGRWGKGGPMDSVSYTRHSFFSSGWRTDGTAAGSVRVSCRGREAEPTNLPEGRFLVCLLPYSRLPLTPFKHHTPKIFFLYFAKENI